MSFWQRTIAGFYFLDEADSQRPTLLAKGVEEALGHRCQIPHRTDPGNEYIEPKNTRTDGNFGYYPRLPEKQPWPLEKLDTS